VVKNLETAGHAGPSTIGIDTIIRSQGKIPEIFLRKAGVPDSIIKAIPSLIGSLSPIDYCSCFISYSSKDQTFTERLYADLQSKSVRCWFAPEDMDIGDKIRPRIEESIRLYDKLLLVLSVNSIASNWVACEVERALNKEPQGKPIVLYPIRLDDTFMNSEASWADDIKSTRHIGDFTNWKNHDDYQKAFDRLLRALKAK
jgi:TIR domain-containing protein